MTGGSTHRDAYLVRSLFLCDRLSIEFTLYTSRFPHDGRQHLERCIPSTIFVRMCVVFVVFSTILLVYAPGISIDGRQHSERCIPGKIRCK
jgi:hypothetical protein